MLEFPYGNCLKGKQFEVELEEGSREGNEYKDSKEQQELTGPACSVHHSAAHRGGRADFARREPMENLVAFDLLAQVRESCTQK